MIIKRHMPGDSVVEDDESSARKRRKTTNGFYPLNLLSEVAAGIILVSLHGLVLSSVAAQKGLFASWCIKVSCSPEVEELKSNGREDQRQVPSSKVTALEDFEGWNSLSKKTRFVNCN